MSDKRLEESSHREVSSIKSPELRRATYSIAKLKPRLKHVRFRELPYSSLNLIYRQTDSRTIHNDNKRLKK